MPQILVSIFAYVTSLSTGIPTGVNRCAARSGCMHVESGAEGYLQRIATFRVMFTFILIKILRALILKHQQPHGFPHPPTSTSSPDLSPPTHSLPPRPHRYL